MKPLQELLEYLLVISLRALARRLPFRATDAIGRALGSLAFALGVRRRLALDHLSHAFPELPESERVAIARRAYQQYATWLPHLFWIAASPPQKVLEQIRIPTTSPLWKKLLEPSGIIVMSGHYGSPELMINSMGIASGRPFLVVVQEQRNRRVNDLIDRDRRVHGNRTVSMGLAGRGVLKTLGGRRAGCASGGPERAEGRRGGPVLRSSRHRTPGGGGVQSQA